MSLRSLRPLRFGATSKPPCTDILAAHGTARAWHCQVGGYQVCHKWLKDRQERQLSLDEIRTYCRIVSALGRTIAIQTEIDTWYGSVEENLLGWSGL
jgi:hypothetical protein